MKVFLHISFVIIIVVASTIGLAMMMGDTSIIDAVTAITNK